MNTCWTDSGRRGAFTLVELLVVIAIIGILIALLMPAITAAFRRADGARARQDISSIVAAVKQYHSDYAKWPCVQNGTVDRTFHAASGNSQAVDSQARVIAILRAVDTTNNPKQAVYLDVPDSAMEGTDKDGITYIKTQGYYLDPWGNPYVIVLDTDFNNNCNLTSIGSGSPAGVKSGHSVCVWSWGEKPGDTNSLIVSW